MIGKQIKGTDFYHCLDYVLGKEGAELIGGNMVGKTPAELSQEFQLSVQRHERTRIKKPTRKVVYHATLSVPAEETLDKNTWCAIAKDYLQGMGFDDNQYIVARHTDTQHNHVHIVASRLRLNGSTVSEWQDYKRSEELIRELEKKYELTPAPSSKEKECRSPTTGEHRLTSRTGESGVRKKLQDTIDHLTQDSPTLPELILQLKNQDIDVKVSLTPTGVTGISYLANGIAFSGTHLGKAYTFKGLQKYRGVSYTEKQGEEADETALSSPSEEIAQEQLQQQKLFTLENDNKKGVEQEKSSTDAAVLTDQKSPTPADNNSDQQHSRQISTSATPELATQQFLEEAKSATTHQKKRLISQQEPIADIDSSPQLEQHTTNTENVAKVELKQEKTGAATPADALQATPILTLPNRNENNWQAVQEHLIQNYQLPEQIVENLHAKGWIYASDEAQTVFIGRTLDGETTGAFVLNFNGTFSSIPPVSNKPVANDEHQQSLDLLPLNQATPSLDKPIANDEEDTTLTGYFWVATMTPIQRAVVTSDPVEVLSVMALDPDFNQTPTLYLATNGSNHIPKEFLEQLSTVIVGLKGDEKGEAISEEILAALPQARRINPGIEGWNRILIDSLEQQQRANKQQRKDKQEIEL